MNYIDRNLLSKLNLNPVWVRGVPYFSSDDLIVLVKNLRGLGLFLLGADGVFIENEEITPDLDWIIDFSSVDASATDSDKIIENLRKFLNEAPGNMFFECVFTKLK